MRVGFRVTDRGAPVEGALIVGNLVPPVMRTDANGEAFGVAPFGPLLLPPLPALYNAIFLVVKDGKVMASSDIAPEVENMYSVDIGTQERTRETLGRRIPGDGFFQVDQEPLGPEELVVSETDPALRISNCGICLYFDRVASVCRVNGRLTPPIPIERPLVTTSRVYYPAFLPPSPQRISRDLARLSAKG